MADTSTPTAVALADTDGSGGEPPAAGHRGARGALLVLGAVLAVGLAVLAGLQALDQTTGRDKHDEHAVLPATVTRLELSASDGNLVLTGAGGGPAVVDAHLSSTVHAPHLRVDVSGATAKVSTDCGWNFLLSCDATLRVTVPPGVAVVAHSSSGDIHATGLRGPFDLDTSSGDVVSSGGTGTARLSTSSGDVRATGLGATSVNAHSSSGDVSLQFTTVPADVTASTSSGDVRVTVPDGPTSYLVSVHTSSGDSTVGVRTDPTAARRITARTSSGDVSVRYPKAAHGT